MAPAPSATVVSAYRAFGRVRDKAFSIAVSGAFADFGGRSVIQLPVRLQGEAMIALGAGVFIGSGSWLQVIEPVDSKVVISIGDGASIAGHCVISATRSITIGRGVSFARGVYIADHTHAYDDPSKPVVEQGITGIDPVTIGDGAWIGENAVILPGVTIGQGAVVGANAVVARSIPARSLAIGPAARVVRRFDSASDAKAPHEEAAATTASGS